jgi:hypothetical protein
MATMLASLKTLDLPAIALEDYPPARRVAMEEACFSPNVEWETPRSLTTTRPYLTAMKVADHMFTRQLYDDPSLHDMYQQMRRRGDGSRDGGVSNGGELPTEAPHVGCTPLAKSQILTLERALKNRMDFCQQQKLHVAHNLAYVRHATEKQRLTREADREIKVVLAIVKDWQSPTLHEEIIAFANESMDLIRYPCWGWHEIDLE